MLIAQISDTHITSPGTLAYDIAPTNERLAQCVAHINQFKPQAELVLVTGDISNNGQLDELQHAKQLLDELKMPYFVIPGNHDEKTTLWRQFGGKACPNKVAGFINYVLDQYPIRLIALDSTIEHKPGGEICNTRAAWLDARLAEAPQKPTIIFMHHPPVKCGVIETDIDGFIGVDRLAVVVKKYSNIEKIICGHIHLSAHTRWCNTMVSTAPSTGMQLILDLSLEREAFSLASPAYQLHYWTGDKNLITHTISLEAGSDSYPFLKQAALN